MKQYFVKQNGNKSLILFFTGWGMDETTLSITRNNYDTCICFDYTDINFEELPYKNYQKINVYGWSMGVWAASQVLQKNNLPIQKSIAMNGTMFPIEQEKGIDPVIFQRTIDSLNEKSLSKFNKRMCGNQETFNFFEKKSTHRSIESLKNELISIQSMAQGKTIPAFLWDKAIIGSRDLIFLPQNQIKAWENTQYEIVNEAHFFDFNKYANR